MAGKAPGYIDLKTAFEHKNFQPLYFLYGEEDFLTSDLEATLIENALESHERDFNLDVIYGAETDINSVVSMCASYPVMAQRRVVVVRDFDKIKDNSLFMSYIDKPNPTAVVLLSCRSKPNLNTNPYRALKKKAVAVEFKTLKERDFGSWLNSYIKKQGYSADGRAVQMLVEFIGQDLRVASSEVDKLLSFLGDRKKIEVDDVLLASGQTREYNVFELQKAIGTDDYTRALDITERLLQQASNSRGEAVKIIAILNAYFIKLWRLTECQKKGMPHGEVAQHIGVPPYFLKEYIRSLRFFNGNRIHSAFKLLLAADFEIKGGSKRDERLIMNLLIRGLLPARAAQVA